MKNRLLRVALAAAALCTLFAGEARATCFTAPAKNPAPVAQLGRVASVQFAAANAAQPDASTPDTVVGMWHTVYFLGDGPTRYDEAIQQFHAGGTEMMLSNGLPPALGNVCLGAWKQTGGRTFALRHLAWNWNPDGSFAGLFEMLVSLSLDRSGDNIVGTWVAHSWDPAGNPIPALAAEGTVRSTRVRVD
jgi:hypothetical protein